MCINENGQNSSEYKTKRTVKSASFFLAGYMCVPSINAVISSFTTTFIGVSVMTLLYIFFAVALLLHLLLFVLNKGQKIGIKIVSIFLVILAFFLKTRASSVVSSVGISEFVIYVFLPIIFAQFLVIDCSCFLKCASTFPSFGVLFLSKIFIVDPVFNYIEMGICYAFLTPIICNIAFLFCYFKREKTKGKMLMLIVSACNLIFLTQLIYYGSRGPLLAIAICIAFFFMFSCKGAKRGIHISGVKTFFIIILAFVLVLNFWKVLEIFNKYMIQNDINIKFVEKMLRLHKQGDVLNGRDLDYDAAISGIRAHPIFGNGLSTFEYYTGYAYPHNLVLQLLYDGGIVLFAFILIPIVFAAVKWCKNCTSSSFALVSCLLLASVPGAMFSGDVWTKPILWYVFSLLCVYSSNRNQTLLCV